MILRSWVSVLVTAASLWAGVQAQISDKDAFEQRLDSWYLGHVNISWTFSSNTGCPTQTFKPLDKAVVAVGAPRFKQDDNQLFISIAAGDGKNTFNLMTANSTSQKKFWDLGLTPDNARGHYYVQGEMVDHSGPSQKTMNYMDTFIALEEDRKLCGELKGVGIPFKEGVEFIASISPDEFRLYLTAELTSKRGSFTFNYTVMVQAFWDKKSPQLIYSDGDPVWEFQEKVEDEDSEPEPEQSEEPSATEDVGLSSAPTSTNRLELDIEDQDAPTKQENQEKAKSSLQRPEIIAAIVVPSAIGLILAALTVFLCCRRHKQREAAESEKLHYKANDSESSFIGTTSRAPTLPLHIEHITYESNRDRTELDAGYSGLVSTRNRETMDRYSDYIGDGNAADRARDHGLSRRGTRGSEIDGDGSEWVPVKISMDLQGQNRPFIPVMDKYGRI